MTKTNRGSRRVKTIWDRSLSNVWFRQDNNGCKMFI